MPKSRMQKSTKRKRSRSPRSRSPRTKNTKSRRIALPTRGTLSFGKDKLTFNDLVQSQGINWSYGQLYVGWLTMTGIKTINEIDETTGNLREVHAYFAGNIWPVNDERNFTPVQLSAEQLFGHFVRPEFCKGDLSPEYVNESIGYSTDIFVLFYPTQLVRNTRTGIHTSTGFYSVGFLTGYKYNPTMSRGFYIDIICVLPKDENGVFNQHSGNTLLNLVELIMYGIGITEIHLSALPTVLTYYPRLGFFHRESCDKDPDPQFLNYKEGLLNKIKTKTLPKTNELAIEDPDILDRMIDLSLKKYGSKNAKCTPVKQNINGVEIMKSREEILYDLVENGCWDSGHRMTKCLPRDRPVNYIYPYEHLLNVFPRPAKPSHSSKKVYSL